MSGRSIVIASLALAVGAGVPLYYFATKKKAAASLDDLIAERFRAPRACAFREVAVPSGGKVTCNIAYDDAESSGLVLVLGTWDRGAVKVPQGMTYVENKVAGVFKPHGDDAWLGRVRVLPDVIVATAVEGGALAIWKGLPSRESVLAHFEAAR